MKNISFIKYLNKIDFTPGKAGWFLYYLVLSFLLLFLLLRNPILNYSIKKINRKIQFITNDTVTIEKFNFTDARSIFIKNISVYKTGSDTLFHSDSIQVTI